MAKADPEGAGTRVARPGAPGVVLISVFAVVAIAVAGLAEAGAWWVPFVAGVYAGLASLRWRRVVLVTVVGCVVGWVLPLWILALLGYPSGATARAIAAFAGLPPYAAVIIVVTLLLAAAQALAGAWLARAVGHAVAPARRP
ncbi:MAG TPA: hypothetical protein VI365_14485 [Trebonia sp.]